MSDVASGRFDPRSLYKRELPRTAVPYSSVSGKKLFQEALQKGTLETFFPLSEQFRTQDDPAFCGLTTLTMILNALSVDPYRTWKGIWRWYHETMLDCCVSLDKIKEGGITLPQFICLAECNGCKFDLIQRVALAPDQPPVPLLEQENRCSLSQRLVLPKDATAHCTHTPRPLPDPASLENHVRRFRSVVRAVSRDASSSRFVVVSYDRAALQQTMSGHFSPIGGYHEGEDMVLILDVARFKYPPHWVPLRDLVSAMSTVDPATGDPRGYMVIRKATGPDYGRLTLFQIELPPRSESAGMLASFQDSMSHKLQKALSQVPLETSAPTSDPSFFSFSSVFATTFRCFLKAVGRSPKLKALIATARRVRPLVDLPCLNCDGFNTLSSTSSSGNVPSQHVLDEEGATVIRQFEAFPAFGACATVLDEERATGGALHTMQMQGFPWEPSSNGDVSATAHHVFLAVFLALLPYYRTSLPASAWNVLALNIVDKRLLGVATLCDAESGQVCQCTKPRGTDMVCVILRLREILSQIETSCTEVCAT